MATETETFKLSSLVGSAGIAGNGEVLVNTLADHYPEALQAAQLKRINEGLTAELTDADRRKIAKIAGVDEVEDAVVRGGESRGDEAVVTYAIIDDAGEVWKGCFPHADLTAGKSDGHVSQQDSLAKSAAAEEHRRNAPLRAQARAETDPFALLDASADDLVELMRRNPDRVDQVKALEKTRGKSARKTVLEFEPEPDDSSSDED